jgi:hypothetical protein
MLGVRAADIVNLLTLRLWLYKDTDAPQRLPIKSIYLIAACPIVVILYVSIYS